MGFFANQLLDGTAIGCISDRSIAKGGSPFTVNAGTYDVSQEKYFSITNGPSYRQIINFADLESSVFIYPMGQSGNPFSSKYDNLLSLWSLGQYLPMVTQGYQVEHTFNILAKGNPFVLNIQESSLNETSFENSTSPYY